MSYNFTCQLYFNLAEKEKQMKIEEMWCVYKLRKGKDGEQTPEAGGECGPDSPSQPQGTSPADPWPHTPGLQ